MDNRFYRPEIDGLRALAVLGVVFFHAGLSFSGGYVGVDVFFVISGFLITQIILRESQQSKFSLVNFWMRRIRRIIPAAVVVVLVTALIGYLLLDPTSLIVFGKSAIAHSAMLANVYFWQSTDYFAESAELMPMLHTWSLSVEEQFYLFFPILMIFLLRRKKSSMVLFLCMLGAVSFMLSVVVTPNYPAAAFYLLPTRAWELTAGCILAIAGDRLRVSKPWAEIFSALGIAGILFSMFFFTESTPFPGSAAFIPVLGAVFFIAANSQNKTLAGRLLSLKPVVFIGLISYSLYLWHWPILVFLKHSLIEVSLPITLVALAAILLLSILSWKFVETPFRTSSRLRKPFNAFTFGAVASGVVAVVGLAIWQMKGLPSRFDQSMITIIQDIKWHGVEYETMNANGKSIGRGDGDEAFDFVLWGDSHGMAVAKLVDTLAEEKNLKGLALVRRSQPPITGVWRPSKGGGERKTATQLNKASFDRIIESGVKDVIMVCRWDIMVNGMSEIEIDEKNGIHRNYAMVIDSPEMSPTPENSREAIFRQFTKMSEEFASHDVRIWLVMQVPTASRRRVARDFYLKQRFPTLNDVDFRLDTSREDYEQWRKESVDLLNRLQADNVILIDPIEAFYGAQSRLRLFGDRAYYRDEDHLSRHGADFYLRSTFTDILEDIAGKKSSLLIDR